MVKISDKLSESLGEYLILTDWVKCRASSVSLETKLGENITLQYPYMTARMQCVVGPEMAVAAGRHGILTCIPRSLRDIDKQAIIDSNKNARLKKGDVEYIKLPEWKSPETPVEKVVELVNKTGHSVIPIIGWNPAKLYGIYVHNPNNPPSVPPDTPVSKIMIPIMTKGAEHGIPVLYEDDKEEIKRIFAREERRFIPVVDRQGIFQKLAFQQKFDTNFIGIAISTGENWEEEIERWGPQVDTMMIDSSNACYDDAIKVLKEAKKKFPDKPFGIGNIIQGRHFTIFAEAGADYIICGMGVGSICQTGSERGNGRGQFTVAKECAEARDAFYKKTGKYAYLVIDGGIKNKLEMTVALAFGDLIMMGNYFNRFYEAAGQKFDAAKQPTSEEGLIKYVETWGEGHPRARLVALYGINFRQALAEKNVDKNEVAKVLERYGHSTISTATIEGVVGTVRYRGRLKPCVENDARYIKTTISNSGASNLAEFREKAVLEKASAHTLLDMKPHDVEITEVK